MLRKSKVSARYAGVMRSLSMALTVAGCGAGSVVPPPPVRPVSVAVPAPAPPRAPTRAAPYGLQARVDALVRGFPGRAGAAIVAVDEGWTVQSGGRLSLPQQSVSKLWVAMTLMSQRDQGRVRLDDPITVTASDLTLFHQPIAALVRRDGVYATTVGDLLFRALTQSDNTANDRLLRLVGGPAAVRNFIADRGLGAIRFGPGERLLQAGTAGLTWDQSMSVGRGFEAARAKLPLAVRTAAFDRYNADPVDGAAPLAIAEALARLARGELLTETSTRLLLSTMAASRTGRLRLRSAVPAGWQLAHKTGTGQTLGARNAGLNDVGLLTAPDGRRFAIAVMIGDTRASTGERQALIRDVAATVTGGARGAGGGTEDDEG